MDNLQDRRDSKGNWLKWLNPATRSRAGLLWANLEKRLKNNENYLLCKNNFRCFQSFTDWCMNQEGYYCVDVNQRKWALDKDIIGDGFTYDEQSCCFVPQYLNSLLTDRYNKRGECPLGVDYMISHGKYRARVNSWGKSLYLGLYNKASEAHKAWQVAKSDQIMEAIVRYNSEISGKNLTVENSLIEIAEKLKQDSFNNIETIKF